MSFRSVILLVKDPLATMKLFQTAFGMAVSHQSEELVELCSVCVRTKVPLPNVPPIILKGSADVATLCTGYSPTLCLDVACMEDAIQQAMVMGSTLDGPIKYPAHGKFAALRTPDGHMVGLFEQAEEA